MYSLLFFLSLLTLSSWSTASDPEDNRDYYQILGVSKRATQREITKAFRKLALQYHPDKNKSPEAETEFRKIASAYEVLSKEESRKKYDRLGHHAYTKGGAGGESSFDMHDFFRGFDFFRDHGHDDGSHRGGFRFNFGDLFGDDDDIFGGDHSYSFSEEVRHGHRAGGQRCETKTIRRGNTVITQTHCS